MVSVELFKVVREKSTSIAITGLQDTNGSRITDPGGINRISAAFYRSLYS
jgi:hypothetical protein